MHSNIIFVLIFTLMNVAYLVALEVKDKRKDNFTLNHSENESGSTVLSRRKRFVIFPEGSSLQLVLCVQTSALIPIGDIFLYGNTIALAWQLPTDPKDLHLYKDYKSVQRRGDTTKKIVYYDEGGKLIEEIPYKRKTIINPAFAKRSAEQPFSYKEQLKIKLEQMRHMKQVRRDYTEQYLEKDSIDFHRNSRVELYGKIEKLLSALGQDGRKCVLHKLCTAARQTNTQGTFIQEFMKALFTLPKGTPFEKEEHKEYDQAHDPNLNCIEKYTDCDESDIKL